MRYDKNDFLTGYRPADAAEADKLNNKQGAPCQFIKSFTFDDDASKELIPTTADQAVLIFSDTVVKLVKEDMTNQNKIAGHNIRIARFKLGVKQAELAEMISKTQKEVGAIERGEIELTLTDVYEIEQALRLPAGTILDGI